MSKSTKEQFARWYALHGKERYQRKRAQVLANNKRWRNSAKGKIYFQKREIRQAIKIKARKMLREAVRAGKIQRLPCEQCGSAPTHGHHTDYSKPLYVIWLCVKHHSAIHSK